MRSLVLGISLLVSLSTSADQVFFKSLGHHKITGDISISNSLNTTTVNYSFENVPIRQNYALVVYEKGSCENYSSTMKATAIGKDGKTTAFNWQSENALVTLEWSSFHEDSYNRPLGPYEGRNSNLRAGALNGYLINNIDFKAKVLVLEEADSANKPNGVGVACGIHP